MKEGILDIGNTKQLNNLDNLLKENNTENKKAINIKSNIKDFNEAKKYVKDNYINKIKKFSILKIEKGTLCLPEFIFMGSGFVSLFELILLAIMFPTMPNIGDSDFNKELGKIALPFLSIFFLPLIYKFLPKKYIRWFTNVKKIKNNEKTIIDNIEYFLPMSKERLNLITKNNIELRKYIIKNPQICHSQYSIDKALGKKCAFEDYLDDDIREFFDSENSLYINTSDVGKITLNDILLSEQSNLLPLNDSNISMKEFKVIYAIEHGPKKSIIVTHTHKDRAEFESYINSFVENNYNRKCNILSIEEI